MTGRTPRKRRWCPWPVRRENNSAAEDARPGADPSLRAIVRCFVPLELLGCRRCRRCFPEPARDLGENRTKINETHRHPHKESADLLIFFRTKSPSGSNRLPDSESVAHGQRVNRTDRHWRKSKNYPERATSDTCAEQIEDRPRRRKPFFFPRRDDLNPKKCPEHKQRNGLQGIDRTRRYGGVAKRRPMPDPHRTYAGDPASHGMGEKAPPPSQ